MALLIYDHGRRDEMKVALTFDDGPNPPRTDQILQILESRGARGTFFVLGKWVERWPEAFMRIVSGGHTVANHSHLHQAHLGDFDHAEAVLGNLMGRPTRHLRAHYFNYFTCLVSPLAMSSHIQVVDSDVNPADWNKSDPLEIIDATLNHPALAPGSIIDLHDSSETEDDGLRLARPLPLIEALPAIVDGLQARGYELVGLDDMTMVEPTLWQPDDRAMYASQEVRDAIFSLGSTQE